MQSAKYIANICDCHRSFLFVFAQIFAVFFALCKKYRNFVRFFLRSAKYIANICGIFYGVQIIAPKYTLFFPKIFAELYELLNKMQIFAQSFVHHWQFCKKYHTFLQKYTLCKKYRRFTPQILLLTQNITAKCTLCILLRGGWGGGGHLW